MADLVEAVKNGRPGWGLETQDGQRVFFGRDKYNTLDEANAAAEKYTPTGDVELADNPVAGPPSWSDTFANVPESAEQFVSDMAQIVVHPIDTATSIAALGRGIYQKFVPGQQPDEATADAVGRFFVERYGGAEEIKRTIITDPVGALADLATVLTGGGAALARAPSAVGKIGKVAQAAGNVIDPVAVPLKAAASIGSGIAKPLVGLTTGVGGAAIRTAAEAGKTGGQMAKDFLANMRGKVPIDDVINDAAQALAQLRSERAAKYTAQMAKITDDPAVLDIAPILEKLRDVGGEGLYHGKVVREEVAGTFNKIAKKIIEWGEADPAIFRTVEGLDKLKQAVGSIRQNTKFGTADRKVANDMYHAIRDVIAKQAPDYADTMADYERATDLILEIQDEFSLAGKKTPKASTALKKLQSIMRNNVYTSYGRRAQLAAELEKAGAAALRPKLAGQALSPLAPRGLARAPAAGAALFALGDPTFLSTLPLTSPRLMGEAAYYGAKGGRFLAPAGRAGYQAARLQETELPPPYAMGTGWQQ
jgi:hypothetical protein